MRTLILVVSILFVTQASEARGRRSYKTFGTKSYAPRAYTPRYTPVKSYKLPRPSQSFKMPSPKLSPSIRVPRDRSGHIKRSYKSKVDFQRYNPCPSTGSIKGGCRGYQIDHKVPLFKGGSDTPNNMQWLTIEKHKQKTKMDLKSQ